MDITLCTSTDCPLKDQCFRAQATGGKWQSYTDFYVEKYKCEYFIKVKVENK